MTLRDLSVSGLFKISLISAVFLTALKALFILSLLPFTDAPIVVDAQSAIPMGPATLHMGGPLHLRLAVAFGVLLVSCYVGAVCLRAVFKHTAVGRIKVG